MPLLACNYYYFVVVVVVVVVAIKRTLYSCNVMQHCNFFATSAHETIWCETNPMSNGYTIHNTMLETTLICM